MAVNIRMVAVEVCYVDVDVDVDVDARGKHGDNDLSTTRRSWRTWDLRRPNHN
jgi:hypothetical protein